MIYSLSIALGAVSTSAAIAPGGPPTVLEIDGEGVSMPSVVWLDQGGEWLAGSAALDRAAAEPDRFERAVPRSAGEDTVLLSGRLVPVADALGALITRVLTAARETSGGDPLDVRLTHPVHWHLPRRSALEEAARSAGLDDVTLIPEPVAAANRLSRQEAADSGKPIAILDIGGYSATATVLRRTPAGFAVTGTPAVSDRLGGEQVDQLIIDHLGRGAPGAHPDWHNLLDPPDERWRQAALDLRDSVQAAKVQLSGRMAAQVSLPALGMEVQLTRSELDPMLLPVADDAADLLSTATTAAGTEPAALAAVYLIGGASRSPLIADRLWERLGVQPELASDPETVAVLGAAEGIAGHRIAKGERFRGRLAGITVNPLWKTGTTASAQLVLWGDGAVITAADIPRTDTGVAALAAAARQGRLAAMPGFAEIELAPAQVLDHEGGLQRRYLVAENGQRTEYIERYVELGERWLTLTAPDRAGAVLESLAIEPPRADLARCFELRIGADVPQGWAAAELIELSREKNGLRLTGESFPSELNQTWARHTDWCAATFPPPRYAQVQQGHGGFLGRHDAITTTIRDSANGSYIRVWSGFIDGRGFRVTAAAPGIQKLVLPVMASQMILP
ncbi:MAG TPA: Hsp70 family protein [Streptosporangiaceae bacterium]